VLDALKKDMESHFPIPSGHQSHLARERVIDDLHALVVDAELLLKATAGDLGQKVVDARARVVANLEHARETIVLLKERGLESAQVLLREADTKVRRHPYAAVAAALGVGVCVGLLLGRRGSPAAYDAIDI
jgi:ElaB/YqjD/DUF883 family membrane-anchored ribosome-binding protein